MVLNLKQLDPWEAASVIKIMINSSPARPPAGSICPWNQHIQQNAWWLSTL